MGVAPESVRRLAAAARAVAGAVTRPLLGRPATLPPELLSRYPELAEARWRVGGLPPRVGGWLLGARSVAGITLWRTIFLAPSAVPSPALLLHELCHVRQFARTPLFPVWYCWESIWRGYVQNRFEIEAESFARTVLAERPAVGARVADRGVAGAPRWRGDPPPEGP